jgi:hypothetical protein
MRISQLSLTNYDTDKTTNDYLERYDTILEPFIDKKIVLLELGVLKGGSLLLWSDYFPFSTIVGIDIHPPKNFKPTERIHVFEGSQTDTQFLSTVAKKAAPSGFDIIIDDASHNGEMTKIAFWHLFENHLKPGGLYIVEDWGTGYRDDWYDGKSLKPKSYFKPKFFRIPYWHFVFRVASKLGLLPIIPKIPMRCHSYGMVGFIKQLIDEQCAPNSMKRSSKFENMLITPGLVFIKKTQHQEK